MKFDLETKKNFIEWENQTINVSRQCELLHLSKGALYYVPLAEDSFNLEIMNLIDSQYLETPFYGSRKMTAWLNRKGYGVNRKRIQRLMAHMGLIAIFPGPNLSKRRLGHKIWPYLLKNLEINKPNDVWSVDITYIRMKSGYLYLCAIIDWFSRYVLSWKLSNSLDISFCIEALDEALVISKPLIFNSDQGSQFTSDKWTGKLLENGIKISMDSKGRALDNIFIERLWRSLKYEEVYIKDYKDAKDADTSIRKYFNFYNMDRLHQSLKYLTPSEVFNRTVNYQETKKEETPIQGVATLGTSHPGRSCAFGPGKA